MGYEKYIQFEKVATKVLDRETILKGVNKYIERYTYILNKLNTTPDKINPKSDEVKKAWEEIKNKQMERGITLYIEDVYLSKGIKLMFQIGDTMFARHLTKKERKYVIINEINEYINSQGDPNELFDYLFMYFLLQEKNQPNRLSNWTDKKYNE